MHNSASPNGTEAASDRVGTHKGGKGSRGIISALALVNLLLFCLVLALDAWWFNEAENGNPAQGAILTGKMGTSSLVLMIVNFFSAVVGGASCLMAFYYAQQYTEASRLAALLNALLAFGLAVLAFGFAIKALAQGSSGTKAQNVLIVIAALDIVLVPMSGLLTVLLLGASSKDSYSGYNNGALPTHHTQKLPAGHTHDARAVHA